MLWTEIKDLLEDTNPPEDQAELRDLFTIIDGPTVFNFQRLGEELLLLIELS